jgi:diadenosine tetraphosphate (Ap4A) HIT family hydrolase
MMIDPHVHTHVLPRFAKPQDFAGVTFSDAGWPALPDLKSNTEISADVRAALLSEMQYAFVKTAHVQHA